MICVPGLKLPVTAQTRQGYLRYQPIAARPNTLVYRTGKFIRRHSARVIAALGTPIVTWIFPHRTESLWQFSDHIENIERRPITWGVSGAIGSPLPDPPSEELLCQAQSVRGEGGTYEVSYSSICQSRDAELRSQIYLYPALKRFLRTNNKSNPV